MPRAGQQRRRRQPRGPRSYDTRPGVTKLPDSSENISHSLRPQEYQDHADKNCA